MPNLRALAAMFKMEHHRNIPYIVMPLIAASIVYGSKKLNVGHSPTPYCRLSAHMKLYIKYMVSSRCKMAVKAELGKLGLHYGVVELGDVEVMEDISAEQRSLLRAALLKTGLELMDDKKAMLIEKIKNVIVDMIHYADERPKENFSNYLSDRLSYDYTYLSNLFSEVTGITIEHYIIAHKIERVKELLLYDELNLTQISYKLNYSSVAHLSNQFKKVTGLTPSFFKKLKHKRTHTLENV
jgi:AraC-like DNA-binding protein